MNSITSIIYDSPISPASDYEMPAAREVKQLEKIGKVLEKQFKSEIRSQFGQHIPKAFVEAMVNHKVHRTFELINGGALSEHLSEEYQYLHDFHQLLQRQPLEKGRVVTIDMDGVHLHIARRKRGGWKATITHASDGHQRAKTIKTKMTGSKSWDFLRGKVLVEIAEARLEHKHVHGAKRHAKNFVAAIEHSIIPTAFLGLVRGMENFSHSNKLIPSKQANAVGGLFSIATIGAGLHEINESHHHYNDSKKIQALRQQIETDESEELRRMEKHLRRQALGALVLGGVNTLEGSTTLVYTTVVKTTAIAAATSTLAVALGATSGGLTIAAGISSAVIHGHKLKKVSKRLSALKALHEEPGFKDKDALLKDFTAMQKRQLKNKKMNQCLNLTGDGMVVVGGVLMTAALVTGASTLGIGAGAVLGGALVGYGAAYGTKAYKNHQYKQEQKAMTAEDIARLDNLDELKSDIGIMLRLAEGVKEESTQENRPYTEQIVKGYLGIEPTLFLGMMEAVHTHIQESIEI